MPTNTPLLHTGGKCAPKIFTCQKSWAGSAGHCFVGQQVQGPHLKAAFEAQGVHNRTHLHRDGLVDDAQVPTEASRIFHLRGRWKSEVRHASKELTIPEGQGVKGKWESPPGPSEASWEAWTQSLFIREADVSYFWWVFS